MKIAILTIFVNTRLLCLSQVQYLQFYNNNYNDNNNNYYYIIYKVMIVYVDYIMMCWMLRGMHDNDRGLLSSLIQINCGHTTL